MPTMQCCWNEVRFLECTMFSKVGHGTQQAGQGIVLFRAFLWHERQIASASSRIRNHGHGENCAMFYGLTQSSEFEGLGCKDVMVWGRHAREKKWESSRLTSGDSTAPNATTVPTKSWNGFKHFVCGHMAMCGCHAHIHIFLGILGGR